ncbi:MAG: GDSL-type esterase/lipase family protein, partial [Anaerolinea sp.]|nr:GDSL-type esterase/lipase family protein [Anaerolinea sp.]
RLIAPLAAALLLIASPGGPLAAQTGAPEAQVIAMEAVLRLRAAPSTDSTILDLLEPGTPLDIIGRTPDSFWLAVRTPVGRIGWVWAQYVTVNIDLAGVCVVDVTSILAACADLDADVAITVVETFRRGQQNGLHPNVFAKVGDSITVSANFLHPIGRGLYDLGAFRDLQPVVDWYRSGRIGPDDPFSRDSVAAEVGWTASAVLDPAMAPPGICLSGETPLDCEYRIARPSVALIMFGTNDVGFMGEAAYHANIDAIVRRTLAQGIIPVVSTIPNRIGYEGAVQRFNGIVRAVAREHRIPLWDYYSATITLPNYGLTFDGVHPSEGPLGADGTAIFRPEMLEYGYVVRNLTALQILNAIWRLVS